MYRPLTSLFFFFNDTATTEIYTLSLHDALPIFLRDALANPVMEVLHAFLVEGMRFHAQQVRPFQRPERRAELDRKSTRLNSSHQIISYAVFCLKKKTNNIISFICCTDTA